MEDMRVDHRRFDIAMPQTPGPFVCQSHFQAGVWQRNNVHDTAKNAPAVRPLRMAL